MINCTKDWHREIKRESPLLYQTSTVPETSREYRGVGTVVVTYSDGISQAFNMLGDDQLIVHAQHTAEWI